MGKEELREKFKNFILDESDDDKVFFRINIHFASIGGIINFKESKYQIDCCMSEIQYCNIIMKDIDEIDEEDYENCEYWNTSDEYDNIEDFMGRLSEIITSLDSETDGSLEDEVINIIK